MDFQIRWEISQKYRGTNVRCIENQKQAELFFYSLSDSVWFEVEIKTYFPVNPNFSILMQLEGDDWNLR